jgi:hypothetical protein
MVTIKSQLSQTYSHLNQFGVSFTEISRLAKTKGSCPLVSWVPKHRLVATCPLQMDGPGNFQGSWDLQS